MCLVLGMLAIVGLSGCADARSTGAASDDEPAVEEVPATTDEAESLDVVGTWDVVQLETDGRVFDEEALREMGEVSLNVYQDGLALMRTGDNLVKARWEQTDASRLTCTFTDVMATMDIDGDEAVFVVDGSYTFWMKKAAVMRDISNVAPADEEQPADEQAPAAESDTSSPQPDDGTVSPDVKEMLDSYEAFIDEYISFMKAYGESDDASGMMLEYADFLMRYSDLTEKINAMDAESMTAADRAYYIEVTTRCAQKLLEASL